jgi:hypothetical protein
MAPWIINLESKRRFVILFGIFVWIATGFFIAYLWENLTLVALAWCVFVFFAGLPFFRRDTPFRKAIYFGVGLGTASSLIFWLGP